MTYKFISFMLPLAVALGTSIASADTIGGPGSTCATCEGAAYTLTYGGSPISSTATTETFQITLNVDDSSYTGGGSFLHSVGIKVAAPPDILSASLVSGPSGFSFHGIEGLSASGCGGGDAGFLCAEASGNGAAVAGSPFDFIFDVTVKTGTLFTADDAASVKALYVNSSGKKVGALLSEDITLQNNTATPEPSSYLMLGSGLVGLCALLRRRKAAR